MSTLEDQVAQEQAAYEAEADRPNVKPRRQNVETEEPETTVETPADSEGNVDAVVEVKSLIITDVSLV